MSDLESISNIIKDQLEKQIILISHFLFKNVEEINADLINNITTFLY